MLVWRLFADVPLDVAAARAHRIARVKHMQDHNEGVGVCDTETCRWQISKSSGVKIVHPVWLLHHSLGLSNNLLD